MTTAWYRKTILSSASLLAASCIYLGFGIRIFDLTDPPLDFHPTRQLRSMPFFQGHIITSGIHRLTRY